MKRRLLLGTMAWLCLLAAGAGAQEAKLPAEQKEIVKVLQDHAAAFNQQDAKALAALWTENGVYTLPLSGERLQGRKAIEADFTKLFAGQKKAILNLEVQAIRPIAPEVVSVEGTARVVKLKETPTVSSFQSILVKKDGRWLIDSVRETLVPGAASGAEHLKELAWLIGEWRHTQDKTEVKIVGKWVANQNFLARHYTVAVQGSIVHEGTQIIGWDPLQKSFRSWTFDSDGAFGDGTWQKEGKAWFIRAHGVSQDGKKSHVTQVLTPVDDRHYNWQLVARSVDGQLQPNGEQVVMERQAAAKVKE